MFNFHIAFSLGLIALALGVKILIKSKEHRNMIATLIGYLIVIAALLNVVCNGYYAVQYWKDGYFNKAYPMMMKQDSNMMKMMKQDNKTNKR